jgi:hypothetical protein
MKVHRRYIRRQSSSRAVDNKAGNWKRWYDQAIPEAEQACELYLRDIKEAGGKDR